MIEAFSEVFDNFIDAFSLRFVTAIFGPVVGWVKGPNVFIWCSTGWTCRQVRKTMEMNGIDAWGYTEVIEPENRFVVFQCMKTDKERCKALVEECIPRYALAKSGKPSRVGRCAYCGSFDVRNGKCHNCGAVS